ncbi:gliding motility-associated C-terminal domain-containing protein, partial [Tenacibaculum sp. IB213877]|uniref:T9SS type B sorting domain-containing protein n=1 Tax=Tenacibaculum sp. IB213877 TaxID=3097351 RepID=UPI002A5A1E12
DPDDDNDGNPDGTDANPLVPTTADDVLTVVEGTTGVVNILTNDDFLPGSDTSIVQTGGTAGGTVVFDALTGEMSYTPLAGEEGTNVTVVYQVCNTSVTPNVCEEATVTITVQVDTDGDGDPDVTDPDDDNDGNPDGTDANPLVPTTADDVLTVVEGTTGVVNILTNDDFLPGSDTSIVQTGGTAGGTVVFDALTGEMSYTPLAGEEGTNVTVVYQVCNTSVTPNVCEEATVTITVTAGLDTDGDLIPDYLDVDDDNDGIPDVIEGNADTDNDGIPNSLDLDSDNDGILDVDEGGNGNLDTNNDGVIDDFDDGYVDENLDGQSDDSVDVNEEPDTDSDGVPDYLDLDSDNDGINDVIEDGNIDLNNDGLADGVDNDNDGILDSADANDSIFGEGNGGEPVNTDSDGDGVPDYQDLDSDDDGINDIVEGGNESLDLDDNGIVDGSDSDGDGIVDDVDQDVNNYGDTGNSDSNITDPTDPTSGGNGVVSDSGTDSDGDGIADSVDGLNGFGDAIINDSNVNVFNVLTPNGDGDNDTLVIQGIENYPNNTLEIFNRWGNTVYKKVSYDNSWDGTSNGRVTIQIDKKLPTGTYYYVLDLGNGSKPKVGWIYLNRK